jgi:hypothetical protein
VGAVGQDHTLTLTLWNSSRVEVSFLEEAQRWLVIRRYDDKEYDRHQFKRGELPHMLVEAMLDLEIKPLAGWHARMLSRCSTPHKT